MEKDNTSKMIREQLVSMDQVLRAIGDVSPKVLFVFGTYCPSCSAIKPAVEEMSRHVKVVDILVDEPDFRASVKERFALRVVPTFLFCAGGEVKMVHHGSNSLENLLSISNMLK